MKYFVIEVSFNKGKKWEVIEGRYDRMHQAFDRMEELDLSYPTRIVRVDKIVVLSESTYGKRTNRKNQTRTRRNRGVEKPQSEHKRRRKTSVREKIGENPHPTGNRGTPSDE